MSFHVSPPVCPITSSQVIAGARYLFYAAGISLNSSWVVVATCVSTFLNLGRVGWKDQNGVAGSVIAASVVIVLVAWLVVDSSGDPI